MSFSHDPTEINALAILGADPDVRELALERACWRVDAGCACRPLAVDERAFGL